MMKTNKSKLRILSIVVLAALLMTILPTFAFAESFSAYVNVKKMKVYADNKGKEYIGSLSKKTIVTVVDYTGGVAEIRYNGMTGYAKVADMRSVESIADAAKTNQSTRVYAAPNTSSASTKLKSGTKVNVLAVKKGIAMIEKDGNVGYVNESHLTYESVTPDLTLPSEDDKVDDTGKDTINGSDIIDKLPDQVIDKLPDSVIDEVKKGEYTAEELEALKKALEAEYKKQQENENKPSGDKDEGKTEDKQESSIEEVFASGKYSNEKLVYLYATKVMGYNDAAAAGLLANISAESGFRTNANGDSGRSYGICQWFSSRKTRLLNWCNGKGLDSSTLYAQLRFLEYELETYYPSVHRYMKNVENTADGAYDAAYYFCYNFEAPANKANQSANRGKSAQNLFYPRYAA